MQIIFLYFVNPAKIGRDYVIEIHLSRNNLEG